MPVPQITITPAGFAALPNDEHTGTKAVKITHIGLTATHFDVNTVGAALPGEHKRISTFGGKAVAADTLHLNIRDDGPDTYTMRGFGLYLQDGTLFAVYSQATAIMEKAAAATLLLATDIRFSKITATSIEVGDVDFINPPATTTQVGVVRFATDQEADAGSDQTTALTPRGLFRYINARFGADAPSAFVKTLLGAATAAIFRTSLGLKSAALRDEGHGNSLNADLLDGEHGAYYLDFRNITNLPTSWNPAYHTHQIAQVDGLTEALNAKADLASASFGGEVSASKVTSRSNHFYGGQTYAVLNPSAAGGVCMLRPDGASSSTGELVVATAAITWNGQSIWHGGNFNPNTKPNKGNNGTWPDTIPSATNLWDGPARIQGWGEGAANRPCPYGVAVAWSSLGDFTKRNNNWINQLAFGTNGEIYNTFSVNGEQFVPWRRLWHSGNSNPVNKTGDRMTGQLEFIGNINQIQFTNGDHVRLNILASGGDCGIYDQNNSAWGVRYALDGYVYARNGFKISGTTINNNIVAGGTIEAKGGFDFGSSRQLKEIDGPMPYGLDEVRRIVTLIGRYKTEYNDDGRTRLFFDAEQFAEVMPEAVDLTGIEFQGNQVASMKLDQVLPPAYRAIAQLAELVDSLRLEVAALQEGR